jgi:hypothetical protein
VSETIVRVWLQKYWIDGQVGRCQGTGLWQVFRPAVDAVLVTKGQRNTFTSVRQVKKTAVSFPVQRCMVILWVKEDGHDIMQ